MPGVLLFGSLAYFFAKQVHQYQRILYGLSLVLSILAYVFEIGPIIEGELAVGLWILVMFTGALNPKWKITKQHRLIRKELSIIGFYLISAHGLYFFFTQEIEWFGLLALALMLPLTIISYGFVRKKISPKAWKKIQRIAYIIYTSIYLHLILVDAFIYVPIALLYLGLKLKPLLEKRISTKTKPVHSV